MVESLRTAYPWMSNRLLQHYGRAYGARAPQVVGSARSVADLGRHFGGNFYECEAAYLHEKEWAKKPADFLDRRTKHGLHLTPAQRRQ